MYRHRPEHQDPFLVGVDGDMEEEEEVVEMEDVELVKEIASRFILHWNYRKFDHLPQELLGESCMPSNTFLSQLSDQQTTGVTSKKSI